MAIDWTSVLQPEHTFEVFVRGSLMYLALFALIRVVIRRRMGSLAPSDLLVVVLLSDAAQNGMTGQYDSVTDGVVLCATIIFWATAFDWLGYRSPWFRRVMEPEPLEIVHDGKFLHGNMKREMLGESDVMSLLRQNGVRNVVEVEIAYLEPDGHVSVLRASANSGPKPIDRPPGA
jgi:uncharacterized membrane protein YcaP (DUF421 family)